MSLCAISIKCACQLNSMLQVILNQDKVSVLADIDSEIGDSSLKHISNRADYYQTVVPSDSASSELSPTLKRIGSEDDV